MLISHTSAFRYWTMSRLAPHPDFCRLNRVVESEELQLKNPGALVNGMMQKGFLTASSAGANGSHVRSSLASSDGRSAGSDASLAGPDGLIDILLDRRFGRRSIPRCRVHTWDGALPLGSVCQMPNGLLVVSPEMAFLEIASFLTLRESIVCGSVLCSTYHLASKHGSPSGRGGVHYALTTKERLHTFLARSKGRKGSRRALQALRWVVEGAASEREVELASLLFTPRKHGGKGLPCAYLNYRINLGSVARSMADRSFCVGDFVWPKQRLVLEYDSDAFHVGTQAMQRDARRRNALLYEGYEVVTCTNDIFASQRAMAALVAQLEAKLYPHGRRKYETDSDAQAQLKRAARNIPRGVI